MTTEAATVTARVVHMGEAPVMKPMATPVRAMWPRPSPMSARRFWTRKTPTAGAQRPTTSALMRARCMNSY